MSRSGFYIHKIVLCCLVLCSVSMVLFLNRPSLNDYVFTMLKAGNVHQAPTTKKLTAEEMLQLQRKNVLQEKCHRRTGAKKAITPVMFKIDYKHRVMYCDAPKVASTNLKRLMLLLSGAVEADNMSFIPARRTHSTNPMRQLSSNNLNDVIKRGIANFTKFFFARHPLERLVSAYHDKLAGNNTRYHKMVGTVIVRQYRENATELSLELGNDVTFPEFVDFIIDEWKDGQRPLDPHWRPVVDLCLPCVMKYDFIGKFETLNQDVDYLLGKFNRSDLSRLFAQQPKAKTTSSFWRNSLKVISSQQLNDLNDLYAEDFRLFEYPHYYAGEEQLQ